MRSPVAIFAEPIAGRSKIESCLRKREIAASPKPGLFADPKTMPEPRQAAAIGGLRVRGSLPAFTFAGLSSRSEDLGFVTKT